ncbi:hypothetical protein [Streptomyces longispororuber]|uniref:hypothetical protein n=1 Tax=Streptomyces longispororuber TaxID=68230 RepID=UPI00210A8B4C|nr:hypothetical protein [Streptomyces longispororuber]MCQ4206441.1 hypothetical protein [Streptomyces longispororuber]
MSEYAHGTAGFGTRWGAGTGPDKARRIFDRFTEAGGPSSTSQTRTSSPSRRS